MKKEEKKNTVACDHVNCMPEVCDQTLGVFCHDCQTSWVCWGDSHVPESVWNTACRNDESYQMTIMSRPNVCGICEEEITK